MFKKMLMMGMLALFSTEAFSWGKTGHRIVAEIAQRNLDKRAAKEVKALLGVESLAYIANWADEIRSDKSYDYLGPWHYVKIPTDKSYFDQKRSAEGDLIEALFRFEETLRDPKKKKEDKALALKLLVHMLGDLHQPLHVGLAEDAGGNAVRLKWFKEDSNLHVIWDERLVDFQQLSYTEYATYLNKFSPEERKSFANGDFVSWAEESQDLRPVVYETGKGESVSYEYVYKTKPVMELRLRQAGFRLAKILNDLFKKSELKKSYLLLRQKVKDNI